MEKNKTNKKLMIWKKKTNKKLMQHKLQDRKQQLTMRHVIVIAPATALSSRRTKLPAALFAWSQNTNLAFEALKVNHAN